MHIRDAAVLSIAQAHAMHQWLQAAFNTVQTDRGLAETCILKGETVKNRLHQPALHLQDLQCVLQIGRTLWQMVSRRLWHPPKSPIQRAQGWVRMAQTTAQQQTHHHNTLHEA